MAAKPVENVPVVCIVDDDPDVRRALGRLVRSMGMSAVTFGTAEEFLDWQEHESFDCLLLDIQLPGMSGFDLHDRIVAQRSDAQVIFITGNSEEEIRNRAEQTDAVAFLEKPFNDIFLLAAIHSAIQAK